MSEPPITVLLVDDEELVRAGLVMLIDGETDLTVVGEAMDGDEAVMLAARLHPDVVVMDVRMRGMNGVAATRRILEDQSADDTPNSPSAILVLTTFDDDTAVHQALRAGASGFLLKSAAPRSLRDAIRAVAAGDAWLDPAVARRLLAEFVARPEVLLPSPGEMERLTLREREVLVLIAHGLTNPAIAAHLVVSEATVKTHVGRILHKLGLHDRSQAVAVAFKTGLVRPDDRPPPTRDR